jgi:hypothetical protein
MQQNVRDIHALSIHRKRERETYSMEDIAKLTFAKEEVLVCIYSNLWPDQF